MYPLTVLVVSVLLATQVCCLPVREERSVWDVITQLSSVPRIIADTIDDSPPSTVTLPVPESSPSSPLEDVVFRITRFKRSPVPEDASYSCGGWGKPLPIPPPCRSS